MKRSEKLIDLIFQQKLKLEQYLQMKATIIQQNKETIRLKEDEEVNLNR